MGTIRVEVRHAEADHPEYPGDSVAHVGPAYDSAYAAILQDLTGVENVDLVFEARRFAERFEAEHAAEPGWSVRLVELTVDNPDAPADEQTSSWVEVSA